MRVKLTPEQKTALLAEYSADTEGVSVLCRRWGIAVVTLHRYRHAAGVAPRQEQGGLVPTGIEYEPAPLLPVVGTIRLAGRPGPGASADPCPLCSGRGYGRDERSCPRCEGTGFLPSMPASCFEEVPGGRP